MSDLISLSELFRGADEDRFFCIPDYQRSYSWEKAHRDDLLNDIVEITQHGVTHFTGTIVAARPDHADGDYHVVDGQQRLTSLTLLVGRLLLSMQSREVEEVCEGMTLEAARDLFVRREEGAGSTRPRLRLNSDTAELFNHYLRSRTGHGSTPPESKAQRNLQDAVREFDRYLGRLETDDLQDLFRVVTTRMGFLFYAPRNGKEIGLMFEVINSRGKPLSELDKVKNFLIYYGNLHGMSDLVGQVNRAWSKILRDLNAVGFTSNEEELTFLQSCWIPFGDPRSRKSGPVYEGLKKKVAEIDSPGGREGYELLETFVRLLEHCASTFRKLYSQNWIETKTAESRWLERLSFHPRRASVLPMIVALYYRETSSEKRAEVLELIEKLNFRFYVLGIAPRSDSSQGELFQLAYDFFHGAQAMEGEDFTTDDLRESLRSFIGRNAQLQRVVKHLVLEADESWDFYEWPGLKFFLANYEQWLCEEKRHTASLPGLLGSRDPQHPNDFYHREHIVAQKGDEGIDDEPADYIKRRLGNFILMREGTNISASSRSVEEKVREAYKATKMHRLYQVDELCDLWEDADKFVRAPEAKDHRGRWIGRGRQRRTKGYLEDRLKQFMDRREDRLLSFALERWHVPGVDPDERPSIRITSIDQDAGTWEPREVHR